MNFRGEFKVQRVNFLAKSKFKEANLHNQIRFYELKLKEIKVWNSFSSISYYVEDSARALPDG